MALGVGLAWDLLARDSASPTFLRVAAAADKAAASTARATSSTTKAAAAMGVAGKKLTHGLTVPLLGIAAVSVKAATDFQASMQRISTQAGGTQRDVVSLSKQVLAMKGAQQGPNQLADALYHLKSVGMDNADAMKALKVGSDLAAVGNADLEDTVNALAGAWRTGIRGAKDFGNAAATVNAIIGAGNMTLPDFTEALSTGILPSAKTFGLTLKDVGSALALFTDESVPANVAATRLRMTFSLLGAPSARAEKVLNSIGLTGLRLANDMRKPDGLITAIGDLKAHLDASGLSASEQAQTLSHAFGGGRSSSAILGLINNFDVLKMKQDQVTNSIGKYGDAVKRQQQTAAAQFHRAVGEFQQAGVRLGTELLPIATDVAGVVAHIAAGFNSLSAGERHFVVQAGVALAILGPMLSITSRIAKGMALLWGARGLTGFVAGLRGVALAQGAVATRAYTAGAAVNTAFVRMGTAAKLAGAAIAGAGIGLAIGAMTRNASDATKAFGALGSIAGGALIGAQFGPWGAAIGATTGLLGDLAGALGFGDDGAAAAAQAMQQSVEGLTGALQRDGGVVRGVTKDWIAHRIATDGVLEQADKLGLSYQTITTATLGNKAALAQVAAAGKSAFASHNFEAAHAASDIVNLSVALAGAKVRTLDEMKAADLLAAAHHRQSAATKRTADAVSMLAAGSHDAATGMHHEADAADDAAVSVKRLTNRFLNFVNAQLALSQDQDQFLQALHDMRGALDKSDGSLSKFSNTGRASRDSFRTAAAGLISIHDSSIKAGTSVDTANQKLYDNAIALRKSAIADGAKKSAVDALLHRLGLMPQQIITKLGVSGLPEARRSIESLVNTKWRTYVQVVTRGSTGLPASGGHTLPDHARGGRVRDGYFTVGEEGGSRGWELGFKSGPNVRFWSNAQSRAMTGMSRVPGFAAGSAPEPKEYKLFGPEGRIGSTYSKLAAAQRALGHAVDALNRVMGRLSKHDVPRLARSLDGTGADVKQAFAGWLADAKKLGVSRSDRGLLAADAADVAGLVNRRDRDQARLQTLIHNRAALKSSVAQAGRGGFDITSAGTNPSGTGVSAGAFRAQELQYNRIVHKWAAGIRKLDKMGFGKSATGLAMLRQFATADPTAAWPRIQALLSESPKQLAGIIATQRDTSKTAASLGDYLGGQVYGGRIRSERAAVREDRQEIRLMFAQLRSYLEEVADRPVDVRVTLDGKKVASGTATGSRKNARRK